MPRGPNRGGRRLTLANVRRHNFGLQAMRAAVAGTRYAYRNRRAIASTTRAARSLVSKGTSYLKKKFTPRSTAVSSGNTAPGDSQLSKISLKIGGGKPSNNLAKLVRASTQATIYRCSAIAPFMNTTVAPANAITTEVGGGAYWLYNVANNANTQYYAPLYMFDCTSLNNYIAGSVANYNPVWRLAFTGGGGTPSDMLWEQKTSQNPGGTYGNTKWELESSPGSTNSAMSSPYRRCLQDYISAKLLCYGAAKQATEFCIEFIQLKHDWLHPEFIYTGGGTLNNINTSGAKYKDGHISFWESYVKQYIGHPIDTIKPMHKKLYKVIKRVKFVLNPKESVETDANVGHSKQVNLFYRTNKTLKFDWSEFQLDTNLTGQTYVYDNGTVNNTVPPRSRIYMTVRATNTNKVTLPSVPSVDYTPSFDLVLRHKVSMVE